MTQRTHTRTAIVSGVTSALVVALVMSTFQTYADQTGGPDTLGTFGYNGVLEWDGGPYDGKANMVFELYDASADGNMVWSSGECEVDVRNGHFATELGGPDVPNGPLYLSIHVQRLGVPCGEANDPVCGGAQCVDSVCENTVQDPALYPLGNRQKVTSVPFSYWAARGDQLNITQALDTSGGQNTGNLNINYDDDDWMVIDYNEIQTTNKLYLNYDMGQGVQIGSDTTASNPQDLFVNGNVDVEQALDARGNVTLGDGDEDFHIVNGNTTFYDNVTLGVGGDDAHTVNGDTTFNHNVTIGDVDGMNIAHTFNGDVTFNDGFSAGVMNGGTLSLGGVLRANEVQVGPNGVLTVEAGATFMTGGGTTLGDGDEDLHTIKGNTTFNHDVTIAGNTTLGDASTDQHTIKGNTTFNHDVTINGLLDIGVRRITNSNPSNFAACTCDEAAGEKVIGGGGYCATESGYYLVNAYPSDDLTTFYAECFSVAGQQSNAFCYAICARVLVTP